VLRSRAAFRCVGVAFSNQTGPAYQVDFSDARALKHFCNRPQHISIP
jgi:hypothetical protein